MVGFLSALDVDVIYPPGGSEQDFLRGLNCTKVLYREENSDSFHV